MFTVYVFQWQITCFCVYIVHKTLLFCFFQVFALYFFPLSSLTWDFCLFFFRFFFPSFEHFYLKCERVLNMFGTLIEIIWKLVTYFMVHFQFYIQMIIDVYGIDFDTAYCYFWLESPFTSFDSLFCNAQVDMTYI